MDMSYNQLSNAIAAGQQTDTSYKLGEPDKLPEFGSQEYQKLVGPVTPENVFKYKGQIR